MHEEDVVLVCKPDETLEKVEFDAGCGRIVWKRGEDHSGLGLRIRKRLRESIEISVRIVDGNGRISAPASAGAYTWIG